MFDLLLPSKLVISMDSRSMSTFISMKKEELKTKKTVTKFITQMIKKLNM